MIFQLYASQEATPSSYEVSPDRASVVSSTVSEGEFLELQNTVTNLIAQNEQLKAELKKVKDEKDKALENAKEENEKLSKALKTLEQTLNQKANEETKATTPLLVKKPSAANSAQNKRKQGCPFW